MFSYKNKPISTSLLFSVSCFVSVLATAPVSAEEAQNAEDDDNVIETIVVTARKRAEPIQEVPLSITAYSASDLEAKSFNSLKDVGQFTPNFSFTNQGQAGSNGSVVFMRGVGQADPTIFWDPGVGIYVDGVYMGRAQGIDLGLMEIERVEILRGPQGTMFGKNTIGGAVSVVTAKPENEYSGGLELTVGEDNRLDGKVNMNIPLIEDELAMRFAVSSQDRDGFGERVDYATGAKLDEMGDRERVNARLSVNWTPSDDFELLFSIDSADVRESGAVRDVQQINQTPLSGLMNMFVTPHYDAATFLNSSPTTNYGTGTNANILDAWGSALTMTWDLGDITFKSITSYRDIFAVNGTDPDGSLYDIIDLYAEIEQDQFSQEFQLSGQSFNGKFNWVTGVYYYEESAFQNEIVKVYHELASSPAGLDISFKRRLGIDNSSYAAYAQGTYDISDKLGLTVGLRYSDEDKWVERERLRLTGVVFVPKDDMSKSFSAVSPRVSVDYKWTDDMMTYISAARGFKSGGINGGSVMITDFTPFDPEFVWTYEFGLRSDWLNQRLRFNTSVFFSDYEDIQFTVIQGDPNTGEPITVVDNAGKAEIKGFEMELIAQASPQLLLTAGFGYIDAGYTEVEEGSAITVDTAFVKTPERTLNVSADYAIPLAGGAQLVARLDASFTSEIHHDQLNSPVGLQDSYSLLNARATYESADGDWSVSLFGTNLTDEQYMMSATDLSNTLAFAELIWARGRELGLTFKYNY